MGKIFNRGGGEWGETKEKEFVRGAIYMYIYIQSKSFETIKTN